MERKIERTHAAWPRLEDLIGAEVTACEWLCDRNALQIELGLLEECRETLLIALPWVFTSCLMSISSSEFSAVDPDDSSAAPPELFGLVGAQLTGIESDQGHLDLVFDSIRISVASEE